MVVLHETGVDPQAGEVAFIPALEEEAARVAEDLWLDKQYVRYGGGNGFHVSVSVSVTQQ